MSEQDRLVEATAIIAGEASGDSPSLY